MKKIRVNLGKNSYDILICYNELNKLGPCLKRLNIGRDAIIVTNAGLKKLFGNKIKKLLVASGFDVKFEIVPDREKAKSEKECLKLLNSISKFDTLRRAFIIALGGGVVGDLAGFTASIYKRGIPYIQVPTTLLSQVDSAIGGKTAIDLSAGKNLVGAFYQPKLVFTDTSFLKSLPEKELISGLAETIKYGIIKSPDLFSFIEKNYTKILRYDKECLQRVVHRCSLIKAGIVEKDEMDNKNVRVVLNLGHTVGHAIEAATNYRKSYNHGQAVALGILSSIYIARKMGLLTESSSHRIKNVIKNTGLPVKLKNVNLKDILSAMGHDKKFIHGKNRFVLPVRIGKVVVKENIPEALIKESLLQLCIF
ncbi:MAG: 3-dehydroquinate synthase [Omnitrophica bacterium GWA2_41_15]|nr:MAG: 3-dehydroquinate synthase [Omnitrophica bacterium GWA2_41_15]HAZ10059.1 3-dehydroquinate synthase [Candidatus Omnitrophota bacterium]